MTLFEVRSLRVRFGDTALAVDDVSFRLESGQTVGLVGESGSGKSVTALALIGLLPSPPATVETGEVLLDGRDLLALSERELCRVRGADVALVFQNPSTALNPYATIGAQMAEVLALHAGLRGREARARCAAALGEVGLARPEELLERHPHQLSGGMRQRVLIATALLLRPRVLLCDEPTTALDATVQAQVVALVRRLQEEHGTAVLWISHDLALVGQLCDEVLVMYAGRLVEVARAKELWDLALHPYSLGLLGARPRLAAPDGSPLEAIPGAPPDPARLPEGCAFSPRCSFVEVRCHGERPPLGIWSEPERGRTVQGRRVACFRAEAVVRAQRGAAAAAPPPVPEFLDPGPDDDDEPQEWRP